MTTATEKGFTLAFKHVDPSARRIIAYAYIARKADGTLPVDSGGTTKDAQGNVVENATDQDVVDTPEALKAFSDAFYDFISSGSGTADDMHVDFGVAKIMGGLVFTPEVSKSLGIPDGILPTGAVVVIDIPETERGNQLLADVQTGKRSMLSIVAAIHREPIANAA